MPSKPRKKRAKYVGRPRREGLDPAVSAPTTLASSPPSLPLAGVDLAPGTSTSLALPADLDSIKPYWKRPENSKTRAKALMIVALRAEGLLDAEIAERVGISPKNVPMYLHRAGRNGWLTARQLDDPKEQLEYALMHKVTRNIEQALDDPDPSRRDRMTKTVAEGTLFKQFADVSTQAPPAMQVLAIRIETVPGVGPVREGAVIGSPAYIDGEAL